MTNKDLMLFTEIRRKLDMIEKHGDDIPDQEKRRLINTVKFDIDAMDLVATGYEFKRRK